MLLRYERNINATIKQRPWTVLSVSEVERETERKWTQVKSRRRHKTSKLRTAGNGQNEQNEQKRV